MTDIVRQMKINVTCTSIKSLQHKCSDCDVEITRLPNLQHLFTLYVANCAHNFVIDGPVLTKLQLKELKLAMDPSSRTRECMAAVSAYLKKSMDETRSDYFSVCLFVSAREHISETTLPTFTERLCMLPAGGSVLVWRHCDTSRTSGFMDDVIICT